MFKYFFLIISILPEFYELKCANEKFTFHIYAQTLKLTMQCLNWLLNILMDHFYNVIHISMLLFTSFQIFLLSWLSNHYNRYLFLNTISLFFCIYHLLRLSALKNIKNFRIKSNKNHKMDVDSDSEIPAGPSAMNKEKKR